MPPHILQLHLALWLTSCMKKAGKQDAQLADEQKHGRDRRSGADNIENEDHKMLWITIFNKYHEEFDDKGQPKKGVPAPQPQQYQGAPPTASEISENERVVVAGARDAREEAVERVQVRKELFSSPNGGAGASGRNYKSPPTPLNSMDKVLTLFQQTSEKEDGVNAAFADELRSSVDERRQRMRLQERSALNAEIKEWQQQRLLSTDEREKATFTALIEKNQAKLLDM